ncbi:hypothetical protein PG988_003832 [Apiospora saccharicola]
MPARRKKDQAANDGLPLAPDLDATKTMRYLQPKSLDPKDVFEVAMFRNLKVAIRKIQRIRESIREETISTSAVPSRSKRKVVSDDKATSEGEEADSAVPSRSKRKVVSDDEATSEGEEADSNVLRRTTEEDEEDSLVQQCQDMMDSREDKLYSWYNKYMDLDNNMELFTKDVRGANVACTEFFDTTLRQLKQDPYGIEAADLCQYISNEEDEDLFQLFLEFGTRRKDEMYTKKKRKSSHGDPANDTRVKQAVTPPTAKKQRREGGEGGKRRNTVISDNDDDDED